MTTENVFGRRLQQLRERRRISRRVLAELCGLSKNMIGRYERGECTPDVETLKALCDLFDVSADWMMGRK